MVTGLSGLIKQGNYANWSISRQANEGNYGVCSIPGQTTQGNYGN